MDPITGFVSIVGLLGLWKDERRAKGAAGVQDYLEWLRQHNHHEIVGLITENRAVLEALQRVLAGQYEEISSKLDQVNVVLSSVASRLDAIQALAMAVDVRSALSDQAISILRQMNEADATLFSEFRVSPGPQYQCGDGDRREIEVLERRFIDDDLMKLVELGLLRLEHRAGDRFFIITRVGAAVGAPA